MLYHFLYFNTQFRGFLPRTERVVIRLLCFAYLFVLVRGSALFDLLDPDSSRARASGTSLEDRGAATTIGVDKCLYLFDKLSSVCYTPGSSWLPETGVFSY